MRTIIAVDPGTSESAFVFLRSDMRIFSSGMVPNDQMREAIDAAAGVNTIACEQIESFGMPVGREVFETVRWTGRFEQTALDNGMDWKMIPRRAVKLHLCQDSKAKDSNIRQALIDKYGGKAATKKGGSLYGISKHLWAALAVGVTYLETSDQIQPATK